MVSILPREAVNIVSELSDRLEVEVKEAIRAAAADIGSAFPSRISDSKSSASKVDKILLEALTREIENQVVPMVDALLSKLDKSIASRIDILQKEISGRSDQASIEARLRVLEEKLSHLSSPQLPVNQSNPYVEIEEAARSGQWDSAWRRAVQLYNGVDFAVHLIAQKNSVEDFFSSFPVMDPLLALQVCINASQEMLQSDKAMEFKLDLVGELVLNLTNSGRVNLGHQFAQLKDLLTQLSARNHFNGKCMEVLKIVAATEKIVTATPSATSHESTPARFFHPQSPAPLYP